ncbi:MAG: hypothetical protein D6722_27055, partial [Bacteroidetes bacterium]
MRTFSEAEVQAVVDRLEALPDDESLELLIDTFAEEQPYAFAYLMTMGEDDFNEEEAEFFLFTGLILWQMVKQEVAGLSPVSEDMLDASAEANRPLLEALGSESDTEFWALVERSQVESGQPAILAYLGQAVMDEAYFVRPRHRASLFFFLKVLLDSLE